MRHSNKLIHAFFLVLLFIMVCSLFLPPGNEVWGKVIYLQVCVCSQGGAWSQGGCLVWGVPGLGALVKGRLCLVWGGACSGGYQVGGGVPALGVSGLEGPGGNPPDGYCCGRYASYWNAFLLLFRITNYWTGIRQDQLELEIASELDFMVADPKIGRDGQET